MAANKMVAVWWPRARRWARALPRGDGAEAASGGSGTVAAEVAMGTALWPGAWPVTAQGP